MKKYLTLLGVFALGSTSIIGSVIPILDNSITMKTNDDNLVNEQFESLELATQNQIANEMKVILTLPLNEAIDYVNHSKNDFVVQNKELIINNLTISQFFKDNQLQNLNQVSPQLDFGWEDLNKFVDMGFTDSNDYGASAVVYGPSAWWKIWEWGVDINFNEGIVNIMRLIKFFTNFYKVVNPLNLDRFVPLVDQLIKISDYVTHINEHLDDPITTFQQLLTDTIDSLKSIGPMITDVFFKIYETIIKVIEGVESILPTVTINDILDKINEALSTVFNTTVNIQDFASKIMPFINGIGEAIHIAGEVVEFILKIFPVNVLDFFVKYVIVFVDSTVEADTNHKGVSFRLQNFIIPLGFRAQ